MNWKNMSIAQKIAMVISLLAVVVWLIFKVKPDLFAFDPTYPAIAVFTAIGMCWSGYLSTHTAMLDSLGYRQLTSKAIISHTFGGLFAAIVAHWVYVLYSLI